MTKGLLTVSLGLACVFSLVMLRMRQGPDERRRLRAAVTNSVQPTQPGGVVLWSFGRSATDLFAGTTIRTAGWQYCRGIKEAFKDLKPQKKMLRQCIQHHERFVHVKPQHIHKSELQNQTDFFTAARDAGFTVVAASYRPNALAREVSSFELMYRKKPKNEQREHARRMFCTRNLVNIFRENRREFVSGVQAATMTKGLKVIDLSFTDLTTNLCASTHRTLSLVSPPLGRRPCVLFTDSSHSHTSHHNASLAKRIGNDAANCVHSALHDSPAFSWMLNLHREIPP